MNVIDLIPFLGHSSIYLPFDDFLTENGINWRPSLKGDLDTMHFIKGEGISLHFNIEAESDGIAIKDNGALIFDVLGITVAQEDEVDGNYSGPLPYGLAQSDSRSEIREKLGLPRRRLDKMDNYYINGLVWSIAFNGENLRFCLLEMPTDNKRKHGLCP